MPSDRNGVLLYFVRKLLKQALNLIVRDKTKGKKPNYNPLDIYCLTQLCYEMINVEE